MWDAIKNVKTIIALSALSVGTAYLLSERIINSKILTTSYEVTFILVAFMIFVVSIFLLNFLTGSSSRSINQSAWGFNNKQKVVTNKDGNDDLNQEATGSGNEQIIEESK